MLILLLAIIYAFLGSISGKRIDNERQAASADVLVANISAAAVEQLTGEFERVVKPRSNLILSGFTESEIPEGLRIRKRLQKEEWVCLIAASAGSSPSD